LAASASSSPVRCWVDPNPTELKVRLPGCFCAIATISDSVLIGLSGRVATTNGNVPTSDTNARLSTGSNRNLLYSAADTACPPVRRIRV
jgi:hypothetical protein